VQNKIESSWNTKPNQTILVVIQNIQLTSNKQKSKPIKHKTKPNKTMQKKIA
jgi:hypothetical protein